MSIKNQLKVSIVIIVSIVILLALLSGYQTNQLNDQVVIMYQHPLAVRRAINDIKYDVDLMYANLRELIGETDASDKASLERVIAAGQTQVLNNIDILEERYLGDPNTVEELKTSYILWESTIEQTIADLRHGEILSVQKELLIQSDLEDYREQLLSRIQVIDDFAANKASEIYQKSQALHNSTLLILVQVVILMLLALFFIYNILYKNITSPLIEFGTISDAVKNGNYSIRSSFKKKNEFGDLSNQINDMLNHIEKHNMMAEKRAALTGATMSAIDAGAFFEQLLAGLLAQVKGQFGGIYVVSEDRSTYELIYSIGMGRKSRKFFDAQSLEGELGLALSSGEITLISDLPDSDSVRFPTSNESYKAKELMTLPIAGVKNTVAIISLGSVSGFAPYAKELVESLLEVITARTHGILSYREMKMLKEEMEIKNKELENQQTELNNQGLELMEQNRELERQKEALSEASNLKTRFLSNMSHELRTPLNSIIALSGILQRKAKDQLPREEYEYINVISQSGKALLEMINDILDIAKIESGTVELDYEILNVNTLIAEINAIQKPLADQKNIELKHKAADEEIFLSTDRIKLRQILQNLLTNGIKFTDSGFVEIFAEKKDRDIVITVSDTGIGIAPEHQAQIFEEFKQADSGTTRKYGGTGLGLSISRKYTELLGGRLELSSAVGKGSVFTLSLPITYIPADSDDLQSKPVFPTSAPSRALKDDVKGLPDKGPGKLLLIEDSHPALIQVKDILLQEGLVIDVAENGEDAFEKLQSDIPDCIILDLMMPKVDGFTVLKKLRSDARTENIPVVILTAKYLTLEERSELKRNHIYEIIQKGNVDADTLKSTVIKAMSHAAPGNVTHTPAPPTESSGGPKEEAGPPKRKDATEHGRSYRPTILLVEDNANNRLTARALLKDQYTVLEAENGEAGIALALDKQPDLILMDIALPDIDGVEAFKSIRKNPSTQNIPIVALTASAMQTEREIFLAHGFDAFIAKPIIEEEFMKTVQGVIYGK